MAGSGSEAESREWQGIGRRMMRARLRAGYETGEAFAEALGIPRARLSNYEHGKTAIPLLVVRDAAELVGCSVDELLGRDVDPKPIRTYRDALGYLRGLRADYDAAALAESGEVEHAAWRLCSKAEALGWMFGVEPKAMTAEAAKRGEG